MKNIILFCIIFSSVTWAEVTRPFRSDLCTGYPEGTRKEPLLWASCCKMHDLYFWAGGTRIQRKNADQDLYSCVQAKAGEFQARLIYLGVTAGSFSPWKLEGKQWGNAWGDKVRDAHLSDEEISQLETNLIQESDLSIQVITDFINDLRANPVADREQLDFDLPVD